MKEAFVELLWIALFAVLCIGIFGLVAACEALAPTAVDKPSVATAVLPTTALAAEGRAR